MSNAEKNKNQNKDLGQLLQALRKNEIAVTLKKARKDGSPCRSKFGGQPALPAGFAWPRFEAANYDGETANRPLSFLCQIDLTEIAPLDRDGLLPKKGLLSFFYEMESSCWGFDPADEGCVRVFCFEDTDALTPTALPEDLAEEHAVKEYDISCKAKDSYPSYEELARHADTDVDWDDYDEALEDLGYELDSERHKLLGYANLVQGEMLTECERSARGLYSGDSKSYRETPDDLKEEIRRAASDWVLLFQMASIMDGDYELMYGDVGNLYFYIRKQDLAEGNFDRVWFALQCG